VALPCGFLMVPTLTIALGVFGLITQLSIYNVEKLRERIQEGGGPDSNTKIQSTGSARKDTKRFWESMIGEHHALDERLEDVWIEAFTPLGLVTGGALSYLCILEGFVCFDHRQYRDAIARFGVAFGYCLVVLKLLFPFARVTEKCSSMKHRVQSIRLVAHSCGMHEMDDDARFAYNAFMAHVDRSLIGAELPGIGLLDNTLLFSKLSTVVTAIPVAITFFIHSIHREGLQGSDCFEGALRQCNMTSLYQNISQCLNGSS